jgi:hypothetical protein
MKHLTTYSLIFALAFAVFFIAPAFLSFAFPPYPLMKTGDAFDILTPLVLMPLYWVFLQRVSAFQPNRRQILTFVILSALWVLGQGMHLSANSIGHQLDGQESSDAYKLTYFYDEVLSHYLWHLGVIGLSALIMAASWRSALAEERTSLVRLIPAALVYGLTYATIVLEGTTAPIGVPFALIGAIVPLWSKRHELTRRPGLAFFTMAYLIALLLFAGWTLVWGGLPEPCAALQIC